MFIFEIIQLANGAKLDFVAKTTNNTTVTLKALQTSLKSLARAMDNLYHPHFSLN